MTQVTLEHLKGRKWVAVTGHAVDIGRGMFRLRVRAPGFKALVTIDWVVGREAEWNVRNVMFA
jgi:hypothetical protein